MRINVVLGGGLFLFSCGAVFFIAGALCEETAGWTVLSGLAGTVCLFTCLVFLDIYRLKPSDNHTLKSLLIQYAVLKLLWLLGAMMRRKLIKLCQNCQQQQKNMLLQILKTNKDTLFARDFCLTNIKSVQEYRAQMPLTRYKHYQTYADLVTQDGTANVMFPGKAGFIALTSGTTGGKSKAYPKSWEIRKSRLIQWFGFLTHNINSVPGNYYLKKMYNLQSTPKLTLSKSGIEQGFVSVYMAGKEPIDIYLYLVPRFPLNEEGLLMYVYLAVGLLQKDITSILAITSSTLLTFFKTLELRWESLCDDIEHGYLSTALDLPTDVRMDLNRCMYKDPSRAEFLRSEFRHGFSNIVKRIWPQCCCVFGIRTGAFQIQAKLLREKYIGDLPILSGLHTGTESVYGINLRLLDEQVRYTLLTDLNFFEFILEEEMDDEKPTTWMAHQLEVGRSYEVVVTTLDGLYRYRTEDVIEVTGFLDTVPQYKFVRRAGDILSSNVEKVPEVLLYDSVMAAADRWTNKTVVEFTSVENIRVENITGKVSGNCFYIVFIEMGSEEPLTDKEKDFVDAELRARHEVYSSMRNNEMLKSVGMVQVKPGTFDKVKAAMLQANKQASFIQYKLPRIMRREDMLKLLLAQRLA